MKIYKYQDVFAMAKISQKYADVSRVGKIDHYIYFSPMNSSHGPRIKFYGGTRETGRTQTSPAYGMSQNGPTKVYLKSWMNKDNCPNAFDENYLNNIRNFISSNLAILLLVWYEKLDQSDALHYFEGNISWQSLLESIEVDSYIILKCKNNQDLNNFCIQNNLYKED